MKTLIGRVLAPLAVCFLLSACPAKKEGTTGTESAQAETAPDAGAAAEPAGWPDPRSKELATVAEAEGRSLTMRARYSPATGAMAPRIELVLESPDGAFTLWSGPVEPSRRDAIWGADWRLALEPGEGGRIAVSSDGGKSWRVGFERGRVFCPHVALAGHEGEPDWAGMPTPEAWAAQVLATAVWGCDGAACKAGSRAKLPVHYSVGGDDLLPEARLAEARQALAIAEGTKLDRSLAMAVFGAALAHQRGFEQGELERLAQLAARAIAPDGPLSPEERRTLRLQLALAGSEAKSLPKGQLSPRASIQELARLVAGGQSEPVGGKVR